MAESVHDRVDQPVGGVEIAAFPRHPTKRHGCDRSLRLVGEAVDPHDLDCSICQRLGFSQPAIPQLGERLECQNVGLIADDGVCRREGIVGEGLEQRRAFCVPAGVDQHLAGSTLDPPALARRVSLIAERLESQIDITPPMRDRGADAAAHLRD